MMTLSKQQIKVLDTAAGNHFNSQLAAVLQEKWFANGVARVMSQMAPGSGPQDLARNLVKQANNYAIEAEGDVTPFCLLAMFDDPTFRQSTTYEWIVQIISQKEVDPESRMDAIYSLLPTYIREIVFGNKL